MKKSFLTLIIVAGLGAALLTSCGGGKSEAVESEETVMNETEMVEEEVEEEPYVLVGGAKMVPSLDIIENAVNADNVTTLVAAVKAAGLVETLKSEGPFTVFAPTNDAFNALPAGTVESLLKPENKAKLASILTYHVVAGAVKAADLKDGQMLTTVNGQKLKVTLKEGKVMIGDSEVLIADIISSNGVTHAINKVLLPK
jgi:uncharacterized surface protein with fasciclin (FAS1) repeats